MIYVVLQAFNALPPLAVPLYFGNEAAQNDRIRTPCESEAGG